MTTNPTRSVTKTVSMQESTWGAIDSHACSLGEDRSSYIRRLVTVDLAAAGRLPGSPKEEARKKAEAVIAAFADPKEASAEFGRILAAVTARNSRRSRKAA